MSFKRLMKFVNAVKAENLQLMKEILDVKPMIDLNMQIYGQLGSAVHYAVHNNNAKMCEMLIEYGADIESQINGNGMTPLMTAVALGNKDLCELLIEKGANVNVMTSTDLSPIHLACYFKNSDICQLLVEHGADINSLDHNGKDPLYHALQKGGDVAHLLDIMAKETVFQYCVNLFCLMQLNSS